MDQDLNALIRAARAARRAVALSNPQLKDPKRESFILEELDAALKPFGKEENTPCSTSTAKNS